MKRLFGGTAIEAQMHSLHSERKNVQKSVLTNVKRQRNEAGTTDHLPLSVIISMEGMSNDHTDAATITPDAKPNNVF